MKKRIPRNVLTVARLMKELDGLPLNAVITVRRDAPGHDHLLSAEDVHEVVSPYLGNCRLAVESGVELMEDLQYVRVGLI